MLAMSYRTASSAAVLNVLAPGSGHLYLGKAGRFLWPACGVIAVFLALGFMGRLSTFAGAAVYLSLLAALVVCVVADAVIQGLRVQIPIKRWYSHWYIILVWVVFLVITAQALAMLREQTFGSRIFRVPTGSMSPAIAAGDYVLVDTRPTVTIVSPINSIVTVHSPSINATVLRRVHSMPTPTTVELVSDSPLSPSSDVGLNAVPVTSIEGRVTAIMWSPSRRSIGVDVH